MRFKLPSVAFILMVLFCVGPALAIFGPPTRTFQGRINFLQPTNFVMVGDDSQMIRIMVPSGQTVPPEVQLGVKVKVKAEQGNDGRWYLKKFKEIQLNPNNSEN